MQGITEILKTDNYLLILSVIVLILFIGVVVLLINNVNMSRKYKNFMKKLGNGKDLEEDLSNYMYRVDRVEKQNGQIMEFCKSLDNDLSKCIQKVGVVRYSAFKDTGSDLSFALAMLDDNNDGVILNGIYSREMSNIYAKQVKNGSAINKLSEEEKQALEKALNVPNRYDLNE